MEADVVIVGGGLTGLSLALKLEKEDVDYFLLEARERFGGRVHSVASHQSEESNGRHDLGPSWIWPGQPRIANLVRDFGLKVFQQYSEGTLVFEEADGSVNRGFNYSTMAGSQRIENGVASITDAIVDALPAEKLLLSHIVNRVLQDKDSFRITATTPNGEQTLRATRVVLAAPPRVIESAIKFDPPLSREVVSTLRAIPTWMAGHAKLVALYDKPFWREMGLSGDGASRRGPLMEIHDATPVSGEVGTLFGFVGVPAGSQEREGSTLIKSAVLQLEAMFGAEAANPLDVIVKDWANDVFTATDLDATASGHPLYRMPSVLSDLGDTGLIIASSEMSSQFGGLLEGALEVSEAVVQRIVSANAGEM